MTPFALRHDVGIGDFLNVESYWPAGRKAALVAVHQAWPRSPASQAMRTLFAASPTFRHVKFPALAYPTERPEGTYPTLRDHAILHRMPFVGSAFLAETLDCEVPWKLPDWFDFILPSTPFGCPEIGAYRNMREDEWGAIVARLEARKTVGVVVNAPGGLPAPKHPRLIDLTGQTTLPAAIEVLKRASGYTGIDSCFAILAAQLFETGDLQVRTPNHHIVQFPWLYYGPRTDFSFLVPKFGADPYPDEHRKPETGVVVELRCNALVSIRNYTAFDRVDVPPARAEAMISAGLAVPVLE